MKSEIGIQKILHHSFQAVNKSETGVRMITWHQFRLYPTFGASAWKFDAVVHFALHLETGVHIKVYSGFEMKADDWTGVETKVHAGFQFMYDSETEVHIRSDAGFHVICPLCVLTVKHG